MVCPDQKSEDCNRNTRHRHEVVTEDAFAGETGDHFALYRHRRQDHDVDRRVRVKPEQMLKQQRIAATVRIKNPQIESAFEHHQQQGDCQHWRSEQLNDAGGVVRPNQQRHKKISQHGGNRWDQKEEDHDLAVHGEELVIGICLDEIAGGCQEFQADEQSEKSAAKKEERNGDQIEQRDTFVVSSEQPGADSVFFVQIMLAFVAECCRCHNYSLGSCGFVLGETSEGVAAAPAGG